MKISRVGASLAVTLALALTGCGSSNTPDAGGSAEGNLSGTISGGGATSQEPAMKAWSTGFTGVQPQVMVQYKGEGSGAGRKGFLAGQYQFAGSDSAMDEEEYGKSKEVCGENGAFHIPSYISPIAVAYNLGDIKDLKLDAETLAKILKGDIATWNDPAIAALNEGVDLPATKITTVHRSDESGTTKNFTDYLNKAASSVWTEKAAEKWPFQGESAKGTAGVVQLIQATEGAIGYADASAVGDLGTVQIKVGDEFVAYSPEAASKVVEVSPRNEGVGAPGDMAIKLQRDTSESGAYPIVLVSYHILCSAYDDQATVDNVKAFAKYVISADGQETAHKAAGSAPISNSLSDEANKLIDTIKVK